VFGRTKRNAKIIFKTTYKSKIAIGRLFRMFHRSLLLNAVVASTSRIPSGSASIGRYNNTTWLSLIPMEKTALVAKTIVPNLVYLHRVLINAKKHFFKFEFFRSKMTNNITHTEFQIEMLQWNIENSFFL